MRKSNIKKQQARKNCGLGRVLGLSLCMLVICAGAWAAINRGTIRGTVTDPQGALVPGVIVTVTNIATNISQTTRTNDAGFYVAPELVPGTYEVRLEVTGFVTMKVTNVIVKANDVATVDAQLQLGKEAQQIEVSAVNPLVETAASNFSITLEQRYAAELPLLGRDIQSLAQLVPGVTQTLGPPGSLVGFNSAFGGFPDPSHTAGSLVSVNGGQGGANVWYLDGNVNAALGADNVVVNPNPEVVAEFQVVSNSFAAEYGRSAGAVFNVVLKSGTNNWHGSLYEFNRNSYFHARNPFAPLDAQGRPSENFINWNQFGGTVGGPVQIPGLHHGKNRTFFFSSWDLSFLHRRAPYLGTVPTAKMKSYDFSEDPSVRQFGIYDPMTTVYNPNTFLFERQPFLNPGGTLATSLPTNRLDRVASWYLGQYPLPNFLDPREQDVSKGGCLNLCNNYLSALGSGQTSHNVSIKVDHQFSERNKLFVEWLFNPNYYKNFRVPWTGATTPPAGANGDYAYRWRNQIAAIGNTFTFGPTLLNEARFMFSRQALVPSANPDELSNISGTLEQLQGLNIPSDPPFQTVPINLVGSFWMGPPFAYLLQSEEAFTVVDNVTKIAGKHTLKGGFFYRKDRSGYDFNDPTLLIFGGGLTANPATFQGGNPLAQFLLGAVDQGSLRVLQRSVFSSNSSWGFYVQDDFRITSKLTLNLGLRYDIFTWIKERYNNLATFDFEGINPALPSRKGRIVYVATKDHPESVLFPANKGNWAPRLNFAYSPFANQKTVIRGGINLMYTNGLTQMFGTGAGANYTPGNVDFPSWLTDATGQGLNATGATPAFLLSQGAPSLRGLKDARGTNEQFLGSNIGPHVKNNHDPSVAIWNLQIQQELPGKLVVSAAYVGSKGTHLLAESGRELNRIPTRVRQELRLRYNELVSTPPDLVPTLGPQVPRYFTLFPYPQYPFGITTSLTGDASSSYQGLQVRVEKRFSHGLNFIAAYSAQKTIASPGFGAFGGLGQYPGNIPSRGRVGRIVGGAGGYYSEFYGTGAQNNDDRNADRSLAPDDIPQILNLAWTYELPFGSGKPFGPRATGVLGALTSGWKISGNFNTQKGVPLNITGPCNRITCRPNLIGDPSAGRDGKTRTQLQEQWFNPSALEAVFGSDPNIISALTTGTFLDGTPADLNKIDELWRFGTAGLRLSSARSPGFWNVDLALAKDFRFSESKYLQFRVEAYNAFNHQNLALPNTGWCLPPKPDGSTDVVHQFGCHFGRINNVATDPRNLQFGIKFVF